MRTLFAILLVVGYATSVTRPLATVIQWWANRDHIAAELCENRARPEMKCGGKCVLAQRLAAAQSAPPAQEAPEGVQLEDFCQQYFCEACEADCCEAATRRLAHVFQSDRAHSLCEIIPPTPPPRFALAS